MTNDKRYDVLSRIAAVQQSVEAVKRTTEGYGYKYATLDNVWQLVKNSMMEHGLGWTAVCSSEIVGADTDMPTVYNTLTIAIYESTHELENLMDMVKHGEAVSSSYVSGSRSPTSRQLRNLLQALWANPPARTHHSVGRRRKNSRPNPTPSPHRRI